MVVKTKDFRSTVSMVAESPRPYRWSVAEYHNLAEKGIFAEDDRVELIDGEIIEMAPIGSDHAGNVKQLNHKLTVLLDQKALVSVQDPIIFGDHSEPEPDIALLHWREDFYKGSNPVPEDVFLIIEVADSSARYDREVKVPLYARHGIPEVWLLDLQQRRLEVYRSPVEGEYSEIKHLRAGKIAPLALPEAVIDLAELFER